jgi:hypothetical protein
LISVGVIIGPFGVEWRSRHTPRSRPGLAASRFFVVIGDAGLRLGLRHDRRDRGRKPLHGSASSVTSGLLRIRSKSSSFCVMPIRWMVNESAPGRLRSRQSLH